MDQSVLGVLHLSDLHLGKGALPAEDAKVTIRSAERRSLIDRLGDYLRALPKRPTVVCVTGDNEVLETKLLAGSTGYDLVVPTGNFLARQIQAGIFAPARPRQAAQLGRSRPDLMNRAAKYDPDNEHAFIYLWGTTGLGYNVDKVKEASRKRLWIPGRCCSTRPMPRSSPTAAS